MELVLTKEQKKYLDNNGPIKSDTLQRIYKKSVQDQEKLLKQAQEIRNKQAQK